MGQDWLPLYTQLKITWLSFPGDHNFQQSSIPHILQCIQKLQHIFRIIIMAKNHNTILQIGDSMIREFALHEQTSILLKKP